MKWPNQDSNLLCLPPTCFHLDKETKTGARGEWRGQHGERRGSREGTQEGGHQ